MVDSDFISFLIVSIVIVMSPGADFALVTKNSLTFGRKSGYFTAAGIAISIWFHVCYSLTGVGLLLKSSDVAFQVVQFLGAGYLIYLGVKSILPQKKNDSKTFLADIDEQTVLPSSGWFFVKMGFFTNALNPKTALFFLSFFSQVMDKNAGAEQGLLYGSIVFGLHLIWFMLVARIFSAAIFVEKIKHSKRKVDRFFGLVLVAFGLKLALSL